MKRIFKGENSELSFAARIPGSSSPGACKLQACFDGFGSAVAEERAVQSGDRAELLRQTALILMVEEIRNVQRPLDLLAQHLFYGRMVVSQSIHADTCQEVQISFAGTVIRMAPLPRSIKTS